MSNILEEKFINCALAAVNENDRERFESFLKIVPKGSRDDFLFECGAVACYNDNRELVEFCLGQISIGRYVSALSDQIDRASGAGSLKVLDCLTDRLGNGSLPSSTIYVAKNDECLKLLVRKKYINSFIYKETLSTGLCTFHFFVRLHEAGVLFPENICQICADLENWKALEYALDQGSNLVSVSEKQLKCYLDWKRGL
jgi:hypothetical protein